MKHLKKILALLLALTLLLSLGACKKKEGTGDDADPGSTVADDTVVAKVNDQTITYGEYIDVLNSYLQNYGLTDAYLDQFLGDQANDFRDSIMNELVSQKVILEQSKALELDTLTEEEQADVKEQVDGYFSSIKESIKAEVEEELEADESLELDVDEEVEKRFNDFIEQSGYTEEYVTQVYTESAILSKVYASIVDPVTVTDEEVKAHYDELLAEQQKNAEEDLDTAVSDYFASDALNVYVPSGFRYVKHILIKIPDEQYTEINTLRADDEEAADELYEQELEKLKPKAEEVLAKVKAGEDFDKLIEEYGEDPGMTTEPNKSQGYAVYTNASLVQEFKDAALALDKVGDTTELVASSYGYHIIKFVSEPTVGPIAFETVKSTVSDNLLNSKKVELWNATVTEWREGMTVEIHTDLFHSEAADSE
ncbi:peptidylprolyl isomerase [Feifania hominis]|uniref:Peptidylprolyl isomerase n=1 Tax=Feifania hominis TaxID=2763660 RepID=A0A926DEU0_9FIRM|nr:peptidylprolyl isomerase [Feifania hominis]MBC8536531.1 peptidylprolyl isomerase [Feifania hominis]